MQMPIQNLNAFPRNRAPSSHIVLGLFAEPCTLCQPHAHRRHLLN